MLDIHSTKGKLLIPLFIFIVEYTHTDKRWSLGLVFLVHSNDKFNRNYTFHIRQDTILEASASPNYESHKTKNTCFPFPSFLRTIA